MRPCQAVARDRASPPNDGDRASTVVVGECHERWLLVASTERLLAMSGIDQVGQ